MKAHARSRWATVLLVCRKCEKKLHGGFGKDGDQSLSRLLRQRAGGKGRKAAFGVIATGCLTICPKNAVTVVDGARPQDWAIIPAGLPIEAAAARLDLPPS